MMVNQSSEKQRYNDACVGKNLKIMRMDRGYTQKEIAVALNVSFQQVQKYETGKNRLPIDKLLALKKFYDVPFDIFFEGKAGQASRYDNDCMVKNMCQRLMSLKDVQKRRKILQVLEVLTAR